MTSPEEWKRINKILDDLTEVLKKYDIALFHRTDAIHILDTEAKTVCRVLWLCEDRRGYTR